MEMEVALGSDGTAVIRGHRWSELSIRLEVTEVWADAKQARLSTTITRPDGENSCEGSMLIQWK